jgi:hypothetical protein
MSHSGPAAAVIGLSEDERAEVVWRAGLPGGGGPQFIAGRLDGPHDEPRPGPTAFLQAPALGSRTGIAHNADRAVTRMHIWLICAYVAESLVMCRWAGT